LEKEFCEYAAEKEAGTGLSPVWVLGLKFNFFHHSVSRHVCPQETHLKNIACEWSSDPKSNVHVSAFFPLHLIQSESTLGSVLNFSTFLSRTTIPSAQSLLDWEGLLKLPFLNFSPDDSDFFLHFEQ
jgi:hypothetical protein